MSDERKRAIELVQKIDEKISALYGSLGMKPGEGGRFGSYIAGYEAAMKDAKAILVEPFL